MDEIVTHQDISNRLCGKPLHVEAGYAKVELPTTTEMAVDKKGLIHGGFIFGLADYAAMIAVNDPNVVLGDARTRFKKPVKAGELVQAEAKVVSSEKSKRFVEVTVTTNGTDVFQGTFTCFVLDRHVLDG